MVGSLALMRISGLAGALLAAACLPAMADTILNLKGNDNALDSSGNNNNGVWSGTPAYAAGGGFDLSGSNYISVASAAGLDLPGNSVITVSATIDPTTAGLARERIVDRIDAGGSNGFLLDIQADQLRVIAGNTILIGTNPVAANVLTDVTFVYDGTLATPTLSLYENGVLDATTAAGIWDNDTGSDLRIGVDSNGFNAFQGVIGDVAISAVPEPATISVLGLSLAGLLPVARRRKICASSSAATGSRMAV
nr:LamG-like jellyroll fold domain-containing protein [uncultured Rhodopila sp.]